MSLATLSVDLRAELASLGKDLKQANALFEAHTKEITGMWNGVMGAAKAALGAYTINAMWDTIKGQADAIRGLKDSAEGLGTSVEAISGLARLAKGNGRDLDVYTESISKMQHTLQLAQNNSPQEQAIRNLGLSVEDLRKQDPVAALTAVAKALENYADGGAKTRTLQILLGESAAKLYPALKDLAEAGELNSKVTTQQAEEAERFSRALIQMQAGAGDASRAIAMDLMPSLTALMQELVAGKKAFGGWIPALLSLGTEDPSKSPLDQLKRYKSELASIQAELDKTNGLGSGFDWNTGLTEYDDTVPLKNRQKELKAYVSYYEQLLKLQDKAGAGRGVVNPQFAKPELASILTGGASSSKGLKDAPSLTAIRDAQEQYKSDFLKSEKASYADDAAKRIETLKAIEDAISASALGKLEKLKNMQSALLSEMADGKPAEQVIAGLRYVQQEIDKLDLDGSGAIRKRQAQDVEQMLARTKSARIADVEALRASLTGEMAVGKDPMQVAEALKLLEEEMRRLQDDADSLGSAMRASLGEGPRLARAGDFKGIGHLFERLVLDKISRDTEKLLGSLWDQSGGLGGIMGALGGLLGGGGGVLAGLFGGGGAAVGSGAGAYLAGRAVPDPYAGFAAGGDHRGGLRIVGERGPELEATGPARIFNAAQTREILSGAAAQRVLSPIVQLGGNTYNVGDGVSLAQVHAAVAAGEARQMRQLRRLSVEGRM